MFISLILTMQITFMATEVIDCNSWRTNNVIKWKKKRDMSIIRFAILKTSYLLFYTQMLVKELQQHFMRFKREILLGNGINNNLLCKLKKKMIIKLLLLYRVRT